MNFSEALSEVLRVTKRPDKTAEATLAINRAISYCTLKGEFRQDLVEASLPIDPLVYGATISLAALVRFRRFTYVKPTAKKYYLTEIGEAQVFTPNNMQVNRYFLAGTSLTYTLSELSSALEVGYMSYPLVLDSVTNTTHWMLDLMPYAIIELAAAAVFFGIGDDASAKIHQSIGTDFFLTVRKDLASI